MKYRIKFCKYGSMIFIGHLDVMRFFQKAIRRSDLPIAYSTGFSPHQIMSFAQPLGVGLYSNGEYLDVEMTEEIKTGEAKEKLQKAMVPGIDILSVKALPEKAGNAMASVAAANYKVFLRQGHEKDFVLGDKLDEFMKQSEIRFIKETKKSTKELNLKEFIFDYEVLHEEACAKYLEEQAEDLKDRVINSQAISLFVDASSSGNIKPGMVMEAYFAFLDKKTEEFDFIVVRDDTYTRDEAEHFISLDAVGFDI